MNLAKQSNKNKKEPFESLESAIDSLEKSMDRKLLKMASLVVIGQGMANLLKNLQDKSNGYQVITEKDCQLASELTVRWEKEFKYNS